MLPPFKRTDPPYIVTTPPFCTPPPQSASGPDRHCHATRTRPAEVLEIATDSNIALPLDMLSTPPLLPCTRARRTVAWCIVLATNVHHMVHTMPQRLQRMII
jgi:hypothetical protein